MRRHRLYNEPTAVNLLSRHTEYAALGDAYAMQLTIRNLAKAMQVDEQMIYHWISDQNMPAKQAGGQYYFNVSEVLEWATVRKMAIPSTFFQLGNGNGNGNGAGAGDLERALRAGGIHYGIAGTDKESVLRAMVEVMPFPENLDRGFMLEVLLNREALGSTGIGEGMAIPHPRYPMVLPIAEPFITLCFLAQPIPYSAKNTQLVHTLFALVCPTVHLHLGLVAQLATALRDSPFHRAVVERAPVEQILQAAREFRARVVEGKAQEAAEAAR
jgi:PTS system nitrogen regulatory IIA component